MAVNSDSKAGTMHANGEEYTISACAFSLLTWAPPVRASRDELTCSASAELPPKHRGPRDKRLHLPKLLPLAILHSKTADETRPRGATSKLNSFISFLRRRIMHRSTPAPSSVAVTDRFLPPLRSATRTARRRPLLSLLLPLSSNLPTPHTRTLPLRMRFLPSARSTTSSSFRYRTRREVVSSSARSWSRSETARTRSTTT